VIGPLLALGAVAGPAALEAAETGDLPAESNPKASYWRIDGKPSFSVYDLQKLVENVGDVASTRKAIGALRAKAVAAGMPGVRVNAVAWGTPILPGEQAPSDPAKFGMAYLEAVRDVFGAH